MVHMHCSLLLGEGNLRKQPRRSLCVYYIVSMYLQDYNGSNSITGSRFAPYDVD